MDQQFEISAETEQDLPQVARAILDFAGSAKIFLLHGAMGSGKTTLVKAMATALGSRDRFSSPTYAIINEYQAEGSKIYHMDLYRLKSVDELPELGFEEYVHSGDYCFIEWPEIAEDLLPPGYVEINISSLNNIRYFRCTHNSG